RTVYADARGVAAQVRASAATVTAMTAGNVAFAGNTIADAESFDFLADTHHFTNVFMTDNHRNRDGFLRPFIPVIDVNVSAADGCFTDFNEQIVVADFRFRNVGHPDPLFRFQFG